MTASYASPPPTGGQGRRVLIALAAVVIAGLGLLTTWLVWPSTRAGPATFVGSDQTGVEIVQWTDDGTGHLTGSLQAIKATDLANPSGGSFTGTLHDGQLSLVFNTGLGTSYTATGAVTGNQLTLTYQLPEGGVGTDVLHRGTIAEFNQAVADLRGRAASASATAAEQSAAAATQAADATASASASAAQQNARDTVTTDLASLQDAEHQISFTELDQDISQARTDLATTVSDAATARREGRGDPSACSDAGTAQSDAGTVQSDAGTVQSDSSSVQSDIASVGQALADLNRDYTVLQSLGPPVDSTLVASVSSAQTKARASIKSWTATLTTYQPTADRLVTQANAAASAAETAVC